MAKNRKVKSIVIDNFLRMTPQIPQGSQKNPNYLIANADPLYYLTTQTQEQQVAPLAAGLKFSLTSGNPLTGNVVEIIDGGGSGYDIIVADDLHNVKGISVGSNHNYGSPDSYGGAANGIARLAIFNGYILWSKNSAIYKDTFADGGWSLISGVGSTSGSIYLEPFLEYCFFNQNSIIKKLASDMTSITTAFDFGSAWTVLGMKNFNNKYIAIVASTNSNSVSNNYLFLYDGISNLPNYSVKINGIFQDMFIDKGTLYMMVQERNNQSAIYYLVGTVLRRMQSIQYDYTAFPSITNNSGNILFNFGGLLGVRLNSKGNLLLGQIDVGQAEYIINQLVLTKAINAGSGILYGGVGTSVYYYASGHYGGMTYQSQWFDLDLEETATVKSVEVHYESQPQSGTDAINVSLYVKDKNLTSGSATVALIPINPSVYDTTKYTILDAQGTTCQKISLGLTTVSDTWQPIIRRIIINYI